MRRIATPVWARLGRTAPSVAAPAKKLRRLMSTSRESGLALNRSEARVGVLHHNPHFSFRFLPLPAFLLGGSGRGPGGALGPVYLRVPGIGGQTIRPFQL